MNEIVRFASENGWLFIGSSSGSLVAMLAARGLSIWGRIQTLLVGTITGCMAGPAVCEIWFKQYDPLVSRVPSFICFGCGAVALAVVPVIIKRSKDAASRWNIKLVREPSNDRS